MSEAISTIYDARRLAIHASTRHSAAIFPIRDANAGRQVREDKPLYDPDDLSGEQCDDNPEAREAARKHARHLRKAERDISDALNLVELMANAIAEDGDSRAMQIQAGLEAAERRLSKALDRLDRHDTLHQRLFLAWFDLKHEADGNEE